MAGNYYNEFDKYAAQWLRNLIAAGHIAPGDVDERSIEDVRPDDLRGYRQCHFFAGIGVWSYALRRAGWPDDRSIWTGSCPCQPFSAAGQGTAFADERHLWPAFQHLIRERRPASLAGEQVASKDADPWLDLVQTDLEALGYAFGAVAFPSAGVGAPHIRDRTYWMAHTDHGGRIGRRPGEAGNGRDAAWVESERLRDADGLDNSHHQGLEGLGGGHQAEGGRIGAVRPVAAPSEPSGLANNQGNGWREQRKNVAGSDQRSRAQELEQRPGGSGVFGAASGGPGPTNGIWSDADWLFCRDGKWRPIEPGTFPLVNGAASRVGRLRAYGNAINAEAARVFIEVMKECMPC